jgi:hypothetical protein
MEKLCNKHSFLKNVVKYRDCPYCFLDEASDIESFRVKRKNDEDTLRFLGRAVNLEHRPFAVRGIEWSEKHEAENNKNAGDFGAWTDSCQVHSRVNKDLDDDTMICFPHYFN